MLNRAQFKPGDFSLGQCHEYAAAFGRQGGTPDLLQAAIEDPNLMQKVVQLLYVKGLDPSESQKMARSVLPKGHFFGVEEWYHFFGGAVSFSRADLVYASVIPWNEEELRNPLIQQPHFLFLSVDRISGQLVTLSLIRKMYEHSSASHPKFNHRPFLANDWYLGNQFAGVPITFRWHWMSIGTITNSERVEGSRVPKGYEIPSTSERILANVLFCLLNKQYLDKTTWAVTSDCACVNSDENQGLLVYRTSDLVLRDKLGFAVTRVIGNS